MLPMSDVQRWYENLFCSDFDDEETETRTKSPTAVQSKITKWFSSKAPLNQATASVSSQIYVPAGLPEIQTSQTRKQTFESFSQNRFSQFSPYEQAFPLHFRQNGTSTNLKPVSEIPEKYQRIFPFPYFNVVQSTVFDDILYTDKPLVVCAPTGAGKTVIFELAIIRLLMRMEEAPQDMENFKIVYMAPIKALCNERYKDWQEKFSYLGLKCLELTGDSEAEDYFEIQQVSLILTTPEKWDSMTRRWTDKKSLVRMVRLFLIDEIHLLNDETRGATIEAVLSRMKTVQATICRECRESISSAAGLRFVAASATIPNADDIAEWLGSSDAPGISYKLGEELRPVKLNRVVIGYPCPEEWSEFKFDLTLSYKLATVIQRYSEKKPTLVFCSTRKSVIQSASILANEKTVKFVLSSEHNQKLAKIANQIKDNKLRDLLLSGIGFHHAGLDFSDRRMIESAFLSGDIPVLFSTSTLAMGVNLPAHLVIIKSTAQYISGSYQEYNETQILQMVGRAGRPQFDTRATAVILTKEKCKKKYQAIVDCTQKVESSLHKHLVEHLNAEIVLQTLTDVSIAMEWLRSTFLYIRMLRNPTYYGVPAGLTKQQIEKKMQDMCLKELNALAKYELVKMDDNCFDLKPLTGAQLMARYYMAFDTMRIFTQLGTNETIEGLIALISGCKELDDIQLRTNEKKVLNSLNKDKVKPTIRYPLEGRIKTRNMKINCLIQAAFGCLPIQEPSLNQELSRILRISQRISKCLAEYVSHKPNGFKLLLNATILAKCFHAKLWENSKHVSRQIEKIGFQLSTALVNAGITSFKKIEETNPRQLELIVNRHPPFGSHLQEAVSLLPKYAVSVQQTPKYSECEAEIMITLELENLQKLKSLSTNFPSHGCVVLVGDADNKVILQQRVMNSTLIQKGKWSRKLRIQKATQGNDLSVNIIDEHYVGLDNCSKYTPIYTVDQNAQQIVQKMQVNGTEVQSTWPRTIANRAESSVKGKTSKRQIISHKTPTTNGQQQPRNTEIKQKETAKAFQGEFFKQADAKSSFFFEVTNVKRLKMDKPKLSNPSIKDLVNKFSYSKKANKIETENQKDGPILEGKKNLVNSEMTFTGEETQDDFMAEAQRTEPKQWTTANFDLEMDGFDDDFSASNNTVYGTTERSKCMTSREENCNGTDPTVYVAHEFTVEDFQECFRSASDDAIFMKQGQDVPSHSRSYGLNTKNTEIACPGKSTPEPAESCTSQMHCSSLSLLLPIGSQRCDSKDADEAEEMFYSLFSL